MKFIADLQQGDRVSDIYLCKYKHSATTKNGKNYDNVILQDKTGTIDAKVWEPNSEGISEFDTLDYIDVVGDVAVFNGALQLNIKRARVCREGEYNPSDFLPVSSRNIDDMYKELLGIIGSIQNSHLKALLEELFVQDEDFIKAFRNSSAAKSIHHGFIGGLLEHTLGVTNLCNYYANAYTIINRDLLLTAAICHDIGKTKELSSFPENDYTDDGQFLGHIVIGSMMLEEKIKSLPDFPKLLRQELLHCILAHHGELEYGSPKKPALIEAEALYLADNTDSKIEILAEFIGKTNDPGWQGYNRMFESNFFDTRVED